ncbi:DMT family transporter [Paenibacillus marinisediminis]
MSSSKTSRYYALLFVGIIAVSFSAIFVKWSEAPASILGMYRLLMTNVLLLPWVWVYRKQWRGLGHKDALKLAGSGFFLGLHFLLWMESLRHTTVASSTMILALEPILVMLGSFWLFKHRTSRAAIIGVGIALIGVAMIGWGDFSISKQALYGDLLSVLGTVAVVIHLLLGQDLRQRVSSYVYNFSVFLIAGLCLALYNVGAGIPLTGYPINEWLIFFLMAVIPTVLGHMLFNWLLKYVSATAISMSILGEPVGASILAWIMLGEVMTPLQISACILLLFGVWLFLSRDRHAPPASVAVETTN